MSAYGPQNRHVLAVAACRLLGDERTSIRHRLRSVYDPFQKSHLFRLKLSIQLGGALFVLARGAGPLNLDRG
jgi:hypothetical protein